MPDSLEDRRKALEEEYFRKKEQEALEKLRAQMHVTEGGSAVGHTVECPKCDGTLVEIEHEGVRIDRCNTCGGVWLDAGELEQLEQLTKREDRPGWFTRFLGGHDEKA